MSVGKILSNCSEERPPRERWDGKAPANGAVTKASTASLRKGFINSFAGRSATGILRSYGGMFAFENHGVALNKLSSELIIAKWVRPAEKISD